MVACCSSCLPIWVMTPETSSLFFEMTLLFSRITDSS
jgi:hypothetical protein